MPSLSLPPVHHPGSAPRVPSLGSFRRIRWSRVEAGSVLRRLAHFWIVWSALLALHEGGHAFAARHQGQSVRQVTVGLGPVVWHGRRGPTELVLRAVPLAGMTSLAVDAPRTPTTTRPPLHWEREALTLGGGVLATLLVALVLALIVAVGERAFGTRFVWGRMIVADAVVLSVFNFLPVPPLDGGRAMLEMIAALRGAPLSGHALFLVQAGGLALAVVPMTLWTRWTTRIDEVAMWWGAPRPRRPRS